LLYSNLAKFNIDGNSLSILQLRRMPLVEQKLSTHPRGVATLGSSRHVPIHKFDKSVWSTDALYTFRTAFSYVVSFLETTKTDHDEKAALYLNAILKFSRVALTNYLQQRDIDLVEAVTT